MRIDGRDDKQLRDIRITENFTMHADGSVLYESGNTKVICSVFIEEKVPPFLLGKGTGWLTAEYSMLPSSTVRRKQRDISKLKLDGRSTEIQRLIGRSLRQCLELSKLGERTLQVDCDVIQADGGTRVASINGAYIALKLAVNKLLNEKIITENPLKEEIGAISVGIVNDLPYLDLCYEEDSRAEVDMNVVMNGKGEIIEIQGTGEGRSFTRSEMESLLNIAELGIKKVIETSRG